MVESLQTGIILNTVHYHECVRFYCDLFGLKVLHTKQKQDFQLTCLEFGGSYLMIETGGMGACGEKTIAQNPTKLRFNVRDLPAALEAVRTFGIDADIEIYDWGQVINIVDPDGNRVGIRDAKNFQPTGPSQP